MQQSIRKYSWTPACDIQLEITPGQPRATVNLTIVLGTCIQQSIRKQLLAIKPNFSSYIALAAGITYFGAKTMRQNSKIDLSSGLGDFQTAAI